MPQSRSGRTYLYLSFWYLRQISFLFAVILFKFCRPIFEILINFIVGWFSISCSYLSPASADSCYPLNGSLTTLEIKGFLLSLNIPVSNTKSIHRCFFFGRHRYPFYQFNCFIMTKFTKTTLKASLSEV